MQLLDRHGTDEDGSVGSSCHALDHVGLLFGEDQDAGAGVSLVLGFGQNLLENVQAVVADGADIDDERFVGLLTEAVECARRVGGEEDAVAEFLEPLA